MHRHHLIPKRLGGTDIEDNLTPPISIKLHAEFHRWLWLDGGNVEDFIAWKALSGRMTAEQARLAAAKVGQDRSIAYQESRVVAARALQIHATQETCAKGGRAASIKLRDWQVANRTRFLEQCSINGKMKGPKQYIPHEYRGVRYVSKKALQAAHSMSICGFYGKLRRGEIIRLDREIANLEKANG